MTTAKTKERKPARPVGFRPRRHMLALEPRFLFDGAAAATVEQQEPAPAPEVQEPQQTDAEESAAAEQLVQPGTAEVSESSLTDSLALAPEASTNGGEVVFVDSGVRNYNELLKGISPDAQVVFINSEQDGIQRISEALAGRENLDAIHIISHGTDGAVKLGNFWLKSSNLDHYADAIAGWGKALSSDADVLIYGCDVAATESGRSLVEALSNLTGADVAASEDKTGHADLGGDWILEYTTGAIESSILVTQAAQLEWFGLLTTANDDAGSTTEDTPLSVPASSGVLTNDTLVPPAVTPGAWLNYNAATDVPGNNLWVDDTARAGMDWNFGTPVSPIVPVTTFAGITSAYDLAAIGGGAITTDFATSGAPGAEDTLDATFEIWFKPADLTDQDVLFESGGSGGAGDGISLILRNTDADGLFDDLTFLIKDSAANAFVTADLSSILGSAGAITSEFIQVVAVYDKDSSGTTDVLTLYVNGTAVGSNSTQTALNDWTNLDDAGLGRVNSQINATTVFGGAVGTYTPFEGEIALFRFYDNNALNAAAVATNFAAVAQTLTVTEVNGVGANVGNPVLLASGAIVTVNADGSYTYDPNGAFESLAAGDSPTDTFMYTTADFLGASDTATVTVTINGVNDAPVVGNLDTDALAYSEGAGVLLIDQGTAATVADVDSANFDTGTLTVSFTAGSDSAEDVLAIRNQGVGPGQIGVSGANVTYGGVTIGSFAGGSGGVNLVITFNANATPAAVQALVQNITYENTDTDAPTTGARTVQFVVTDGDGGSSAAVSATVTVSGVNDAPVITSNGGGGTASVSVAENQTAVTDVDATDVDVPAQGLTYSISGGVDSALFSIVPATGVLTFSAAPNFEVPTDADLDGIYEVQVTVSDGNGGTDVQLISVTVTDVIEGPNIAPVINDAAVALDENSANGTLVFDVNDGADDFDADGQALSYTITAGNGLGGFAINAATGQITVANSAVLDFETTPTFNLTVEASDGTLTDTAVITVNLNNLNDNAPVITSDGGGATASVNAAENQTAVTDVNATDPDSGAVPTYSIAGGADAGLFSIVAGTGVLTFNAAPDFESPTDAGANNVYDVIVRASDGTLFDDQAIAVTVTDVNEGPNNAPRIDDVAVALNENSTNGTAVYNINDFFTGNDTDIDGTALTYSITAGNGLGGFAINAATGQITVANSAVLDFETTPTFSLTVRASDGALTDTAGITVNLNDLNEAPVANVTVGLNNPDLGGPSGVLPPVTPTPGVESGQWIGGPELSHRDFVLQGINESLRLRAEQAAQIAGLLTAANAGEIEAVSLGDALQAESVTFVLPTVEQIRSEFSAAGERGLEFAVKPAPGTAPLLKDFDAFSRFVGLDEPKDEPAPAAEPVPDAPAGAQDSDPAKAAPDAAVAPNAERGATRDSQPAGAPAFSAQLRTAAALRKQLDTRLAESLRAPRKS